jgi:hypothetical protein
MDQPTTFRHDFRRWHFDSAPSLLTFTYFEMSPLVERIARIILLIRQRN